METTQTTQLTARIYVACLAAYNNGILHGRWIEVNQGKDGIWDEISEMLEESPIAGAEEWAIHDYEGFGGLRISEYEDLDRVLELAEIIEEHGEAWCSYAGYVGEEYAAKEGFEEAYQGEWDSEEEFAEQLMDDTMEIPEHLQYYIDYEKFARDLFIGDYFSARSEKGVYVFSQI